METPTPEPTPVAPPHSIAVPQSWRRYLGSAVVGAFCLYVVLLGVLALDQHFHWGFFPTQADRELSALVAQLDDPTLTPEKRLALMDKIVDQNSFAVPILIHAVAHAPERERDGAVQCLQEISLKFYGKDIAQFGVDPEQLNKWWADQQAEWAREQRLTK